jgi:hypothetical protein
MALRNVIVNRKRTGVQIMNRRSDKAATSDKQKAKSGFAQDDTFYECGSSVTSAAGELGARWLS